MVPIRNHPCIALVIALTTPHSNHEHHSPPQASEAHSQPVSHRRLATSATLHCLLGCGLGEVLGDAIGTGLSLSNLSTIALGLVAGAIGGFALGLGPWMRQGLVFREAARRVLVSEGLSILVMEAAEVLVETLTPGLMAATLLQPFYWLGMLGALAAGFIAAWPVNYLLARRGVSHAHL